MDKVRLRLPFCSFFVACFVACKFLQMLYLFVSPRSVFLNLGGHADTENETVLGLPIANCRLPI
jgi:hypothetical protein